MLSNVRKLNRSLPVLMTGIVSSVAAPAAVGSDAVLRLVALSSPSSVDEDEVLPTGQSQFRKGDTFYVEAWAQTSLATGLSSVTADIQFDSELLLVAGVSNAAPFGQFPTGSVEASLGIIDDLGGSHPPVDPPCGDQVGSAPKWVRVSVIAMNGIDVGTTTVRATDTDSQLFGIAICNVSGNVHSANVDFGDVTVSIGQCLEDVECDDLDFCTVDVCSDGSCVSSPNPLCGACCHGSGVCQDGLSSSSCEADSGWFVGAGTSCLGDGNGDGSDDACPVASDIPAVSHWGLVIFALMLVAVQRVCFRRRPKTRTSAS